MDRVAEIATAAVQHISTVANRSKDPGKRIKKVVFLTVLFCSRADEMR